MRSAPDHAGADGGVKSDTGKLMQREPKGQPGGTPRLGSGEPAVFSKKAEIVFRDSPTQADQTAFQVSGQLRVSLLKLDLT